MAAFFARIWTLLAPTLLPWIYGWILKVAGKVLSPKHQPDAGKAAEIRIQVEKAVSKKEREDALDADRKNF